MFSNSMITAGPHLPHATQAVHIAQVSPPHQPLRNDPAAEGAPASDPHPLQLVDWFNKPAAHNCRGDLTPAAVEHLHYTDTRTSANYRVTQEAESPGTLGRLTHPKPEL